MRRTCTKCGKEKDLTKFGKNRRQTGGRRTECKACFVTRTTLWARKAQKMVGNIIDKRCSTCHHTKPITEFNAHAISKDGYSSACRTCEAKRCKQWRDKNPERCRYWARKACSREKTLYKNSATFRAKRQAYNHQYTIKNRRRIRDQKLRKQYGISLRLFYQTFSKQHRRCAICNTTTPKGHGKWHTDHNHTTGKFRGILCHHCNMLLGNAKDDVRILAKAMKYLLATT